MSNDPCRATAQRIRRKLKRRAANRCQPDVQASLPHPVPEYARRMQERIMAGEVSRSALKAIVEIGSPSVRRVTKATVGRAEDDRRSELCRMPAPFGFDKANGVFRCNDDAATVVRAFELRAFGYSFEDIARKLMQAGVRAPYPDPARSWDDELVERIVRDPRYQGIVELLAGTRDTATAMVPELRLVSPQLWAMAQ